MPILSKYPRDGKVVELATLLTRFASVENDIKVFCVLDIQPCDAAIYDTSWSALPNS